MKKTNTIYSITLALAVVLGMFLGTKLKIPGGFSRQNTHESKLQEVLNIVDKKYVDTPQLSSLTETAIEAVLKELDPHSSYLPPVELKESNDELEGNFEGIGVEFNLLKDTIIVVSPISGGPSEQLGIQSGDKIIKIEDKIVAGVKISNEDIIAKLRGKRGTKVRISIKRGNQNKLIPYTITRDKIPIYSVDAAYMLNADIGYIKINRFAANTVDEYLEAFEKLQSQGMMKLVLDLRGNPGGYVKSATDLLDEYIPNGELLLYTQGRKSEKESYFATEKGSFEQGKLVVLVDEGSASASEIVSGALQDHDRATIIGRRTFGKGLVQEPYLLSDGSGLRLTVARYYTPSGRCIQRPYLNGNDEEYENWDVRTSDAEEKKLDSLSKIKNLVYRTKKGRSVYGGGGINPDFITPRDTSFVNPLFRISLESGLMNDFVINYLDKNRKQLVATYPDVKQFKSQFILDKQWVNQFINALPIKNKQVDRYSFSLLSKQFTAMIARQLYKQEGYYYFTNSEDITIQKAMDVLK